MKLSLLVTAVLSVAFLSGCGDAEDALNDALTPDDTSSASYTKTANNSNGFDLNFAIDNTGISIYSYELGSETNTTETSVSDGTTTTTLKYTDVRDSQYTTTTASKLTNTLSCTPNNDETYSCTDDVLYSTGTAFTLKPNSAISGLNELYLYKCHLVTDVDIVNAKITGTKTCTKTGTVITVP